MPNPNTEGDREFDCLYLDMNGLIHPCFHPEGVPPPSSEEEVFENLDRYILRLFNIVRPRVLLYMAIDGVAPRAKMNQQRMRRYRSAKENAWNRKKRIYEAGEKGDDEELEKLSNPDYLKDHDSNVITPGTPFFDRLADHLRQFIKNQQQCDPGWKKIMVFLSDAGVPGEGEHKIMSFIRSQRVQPNYDPNRRHVIYGLDADLIFLGLASHEQYFTIIRENVIDPDHNIPEKESGIIGPRCFHFVNVWVFRQYLDRDLRPDHLPPGFAWDLERAIDDFIFLCFAAGNDFIPSAPGFSVARGAVGDIIRAYKRNIGRLGAYITFNGGVDFPRFADIMKNFTTDENKDLEAILFPNEKAQAAQKFVNSITMIDDPEYDPKMEENMAKKKGRKEDSSTGEPPKDLKKQYYMAKFQFRESEIPERVPGIVEDFIRGMIWTLNYYLHGCVSWNWYYKYHYSPCLSDFVNFNMNHANYRFELSEPFKPLVQLMSVLPPQSAHCLPPVMRSLMCDSESPLSEFYPKTFQVDLNGSSATWHGVVKVPFIDEHRMKSVLESMDLKLTPDEQMRNTWKQTSLFMSSCRAPPPELTGTVSVNGPYWGKIQRVPRDPIDRRDSFEFIFMQKEVEQNAFMSFLVPGVQIPPYVLSYTYDPNKYSTPWGKGDFDQADVERATDLPLVVPGFSPGSDMGSRARRVAKARYLQPQNPPQGYPGAPPPPPPHMPPGPPQGYPGHHGGPPPAHGYPGHNGYPGHHAAPHGYPGHHGAPPYGHTEYPPYQR